MKRLFLLSVLLSAPVSLGFGQVAPGQSEFYAFLAKWEKAQARFINGDPSLWKQNASRGEDVTIFGAFGGCERSWKEVGPRYDWASSQFKDSGAAQDIEYLSRAASGNLAYTVGIERQVAQLTGQKQPTPRALRVTQIFRKEDGVWKLLHRHADPLLERQPPSARQ
jgi:ketosteroid isomerase-like protein